MKTFEQHWQAAVIDPDKEDVTKGFHRITWRACDQAWREELGKDRGVKCFGDFYLEKWKILPDPENEHIYQNQKDAWHACETLWRHKCLNIEQASQMKIAILERQLEEMRKDLHFLTSTDTDDTYTENDQDIIRKCREIRQRHKLDEVKA